MQRVKNINKKLCKMIEARNLNAINKLLEQGADINCPVPVNNDKVTPLEFAVCTKSLFMVKLLVEKGAKVDANDNSALYRSFVLNEIDIMKFLIEEGADVNLRDNMLMKKYYKNEEIAFYLLDKGINPDFAIAYAKDTIKFYAQKIKEIKALQQSLEVELDNKDLIIYPKLKI